MGLLRRPSNDGLPRNEGRGNVPRNDTGESLPLFVVIATFLLSLQATVVALIIVTTPSGGRLLYIRLITQL